jgi:hypothetical protein
MLLGNVDRIDRHVVSGWAVEADHPGSITTVMITIDGECQAEVPCDMPRSDLKTVIGWQEGRCGFAYTFPIPVSGDVDHWVAVRFAGSGEILPNGEKLVPAEPRAAPASKQTDASTDVPQGFVDEITRHRVAGWAADPPYPDDPVEVSIFVDGRKVAQLVADLLRPDLARSGMYGSGRHGFIYHFSPPLAEDADVKVAVRFALSGDLIDGGAGLLEAGIAGAVVLPRLPQKAAETIPAPDHPRSLFRLFGLYDAKLGLYSLLRRLDFSRTTQRNIDYSVFGEIGPGRQRDDWSGKHLVRDYLNNLLYSEKFQRNMLALALCAFPEKHRLLFVHIPKCAGTDLVQHLSSRFPSLQQAQTDEAWTDREQLFQVLADFARELEFSDSIFIGGHIALSYFADNGLVRPSDRVFTIVRDPIEIALSQMNYVFTRIQVNIRAGKMARDVEEWLPMLGLASLPHAVTPEFVQEYSRKMLHNTQIVVPNSMCHWLGGSGPDAVIARLALHQVEITDTGRYNDWLAHEWGITARTRQNQSIKYVSPATLAQQDIDYITEASADDLMLYEAIQGSLRAAVGRFSVFGADMLRSA